MVEHARNMLLEIPSMEPPMPLKSTILALNPTSYWPLDDAPGSPFCVDVEPQAGTSDLRFGSVPLHRRERSSRPPHHRNVSASLSQGYRGAVRAGAGVG